MENRKYTEAEVLSLICNKKFERVLQEIKYNFPDEAKDSLEIRFNPNSKTGILSGNIIRDYEYKSFSLVDNNTSLTLIYPKKEGLLEQHGIAKKQVIYDKFKTIDCVLIRFTIEEVLRFKYWNWEAFREACLIAASHGKQKQYKSDGNFNFDWNY